MKKLSLSTLMMVVLLVGVLAAWACTYQVSYNEVAVHLRLGKVVAKVDAPGLHTAWWPIETVKKFDTRLKTLDTPDAEMRTEDGRNLVIGSYCVWRIVDAEKFFNRVTTEKAAREQMRARIASAQAAVVGQKTLGEFVNLDHEAVEASHADLLKQMRGLIASDLQKDYGIEVVEVGLRRISLPKEVASKVFESMAGERKQRTAEIISQGIAQAEAIKAVAKSEADQILSFADVKAEEIRSRGTQAAARYLAEINASDVEFFQWLRELDALKAALKQKTIIMLDQPWPLFHTFVTPPDGLESGQPADKKAKEQLHKRAAADAQSND